MSVQNRKFILVLLLYSYCIISHINNCKPTFAYPVYSVAFGWNIL